MAAYFRKLIYGNSNVSGYYDWATNNGSYELTTANVHSAYVPAATDIITVESLNYPIDGTSQTTAGDGNINCWVEWSGTVWKIHVSDTSFTGVIQYRLKNVR